MGALMVRRLKKDVLTQLPAKARQLLLRRAACCAATHTLVAPPPMVSDKPGESL